MNLSFWKSPAFWIPFVLFCAGWAVFKQNANWQVPLLVSWQVLVIGLIAAALLLRFGEQAARQKKREDGHDIKENDIKESAWFLRGIFAAFIVGSFTFLLSAYWYWPDKGWAWQLLGGVAIVTPFVLLQKTDVRASRSPFGYKAFVAALWFAGLIIYFREAVPSVKYYEAVLAGATIFILILAFRTDRLVRRTIAEDEMLFRLYDKIRAARFLDSEKKAIIPDCLEAVGVIDLHAADNPQKAEEVEKLQSLLGGAAKEIREKGEQGGGSTVAQDGDVALAVHDAARNDEKDLEKIAELRSDARILVHSKEQGENFAEKMVMFILAVLTSVGLLFFLPDAKDKMAELSGFFVEMAAMLIAATVWFLFANILDLQRDRSDAVLPRVRRDGKLRVAGDEDDGGDVDARHASKRTFEKWAVIVLCLLITFLYGVLQWQAWEPDFPFPALAAWLQGLPF